ncbi:hypothetical protein CMUS01_08199 [Colletotrichum musicola]|uniref:Uncharacterized protein n=1 Tax=Colletotrichum musicola TaxID=2175873 RepID=A0A8H6KE30_9PEZI|nr:hypothetical protein CMUS01_08199 [Colletotrichum musicola]
MRGCTHATPITQQEDSAAHNTPRSAEHPRPSRNPERPRAPPASNLGNIDPPTAFHWSTIPFSASDSTILEAKFNDTNSTLWADAGRQEKTNTQKPSSRITPSATPSVPTHSPIPPTLPTTPRNTSPRGADSRKPGPKRTRTATAQPSSRRDPVAPLEAAAEGRKGRSPRRPSEYVPLTSKPTNQSPRSGSTSSAVLSLFFLRVSTDVHVFFFSFPSLLNAPADEDPQAPAPGLHIPPGPGGSTSCSGTLVTTTFASRTSIVREYRAFSTPFGS